MDWKIYLPLFLYFEGETPVNIKIVDRTASITTEINDKGPIVSIEALIELKSGIATFSETRGYCRLHHIPCHRDALQIIIASLAQCCLVVVYQMLPGETLRQGIQQNPYLIKNQILKKLGN